MEVVPGTETMFRPSGLEAAFNAWGANCGPSSIAAIAKQEMAQIRPHLGDFERRKYMNPTHVKEALYSMGVKFERASNVPRYGLIFVQWGGWEKAPIAEQYRHTHWIGVQGDYVFEINAERANFWIPRAAWENIMPEVIQEHYKQANGKWSARTSLEVFL